MWGEPSEHEWSLTLAVPCSLHQPWDLTLQVRLSQTCPQDQEELCRVDSWQPPAQSGRARHRGLEDPG